MNIESIGQRVKRIRTDLGLTLDQFGKKIGLKKTAISRIENGKATITEQTIISVCREFGVDESWLRNGEGEMFKDQTKDATLMAEIGDLFSSEKPRIRKELLQIITAASPEELATGYNFCKKIVEASHGIELPDLPEDFFE